MKCATTFNHISIIVYFIGIVECPNDQLILLRFIAEKITRTSPSLRASLIRLQLAPLSLCRWV